MKKNNQKLLSLEFINGDSFCICSYIADYKEMVNSKLNKSELVDKLTVFLFNSYKLFTAQLLLVECAEIIDQEKAKELLEKWNNILDGQIDIILNYGTKETQEKISSIFQKQIEQHEAKHGKMAYFFKE